MPLHASGDQPKLKEVAALLLAVYWALYHPDGPWHCRRDRKYWVWGWLPSWWWLPDKHQQQQYSNSWPGIWWCLSLYKLQRFFLRTLAFIFLGLFGGLQPHSTAETALQAMSKAENWMGNGQSGSISGPETATEVLCWDQCCPIKPVVLREALGSQASSSGSASRMQEAGCSTAAA